MSEERKKLIKYCCEASKKAGFPRYDDYRWTSEPPMWEIPVNGECHEPNFCPFCGKKLVNKKYSFTNKGWVEVKADA